MNRKNFLRRGIPLLFAAILLLSPRKSPAQVSGETELERKVAVFEKGNPLFAVDIGDAELAARYRKGTGTPVIFVHGSWGDHNSWLPVAALLSEKVGNPIILYDRRGHSASTPDMKQGSITQDVNDALALMKALGFGKANFVGHSYGANIVIDLATGHPGSVENILVYEPPLFGILKGKSKYREDLAETKKAMLLSKSLLEKGEIEKGTIQFIENVAFGKGSWENIFDEGSRRIMLANYRTWLDQSRDCQRLDVRPAELNNFKGKITILYGKNTFPVYRDVVEELDKILIKKRIIGIEGAGHAGLTTNPSDVYESIEKYLIK